MTQWTGSLGEFKWQFTRMRNTSSLAHSFKASLNWQIFLSSSIETTQFLSKVAVLSWSCSTAPEVNFAFVNWSFRRGQFGRISLLNGSEISWLLTELGWAEFCLSPRLYGPNGIRLNFDSGKFPSSTKLLPPMSVGRVNGQLGLQRSIIFEGLRSTWVPTFFLLHPDQQKSPRTNVCNKGDFTWRSDG